jgi:hypothetical protein
VTDRPVVFGRQDQSLSDVEIVITDRVTSLEGTVTDAQGRPAPGSHLIVFSTDRDRWYPASRFLRRSVASGPAASLSVAGLPSGSYYTAAVRQLPSDGEDAWQDPQFLESLLTGATTVTLSEGQKQLVALRISGP